MLFNTSGNTSSFKDNIIKQNQKELVIFDFVLLQGKKRLIL